MDREDAFDLFRRRLDGPPRISQKAFAGLLGVSQALVSKIYNREQRPPLDKIPAVNREVGTTFEDWVVARTARERRRGRRRAA